MGSFDGTNYKSGMRTIQGRVLPNTSDGSVRVAQGSFLPAGNDFQIIDKGQGEQCFQSRVSSGVRGIGPRQFASWQITGHIVGSQNDAEPGVHASWSILSSYYCGSNLAPR